MIKPLEDAIATLSRLPEEDQEMAAEMLRLIAARQAAYRMTDGENTAVKQGLGEVERGEFASQEKIDGLLKRPWR